jgi:hypothetical protein
MKTVGRNHKNQYKLYKILGKGTYGTVYDSPPYAVK